MDWIKIEKGTPAKGEIRTIARLCGVSRGDAFLGWFRLWCVLDDQVGADGFLANYTAADADEDSGLHGIGKALEAVGWCVFSPTGCSVINWSRHNGKSAKQRALLSRRAAIHRKRNSESVTQSVTKVTL